MVIIGVYLAISLPITAVVWGSAEFFNSIQEFREFRRQLSSESGSHAAAREIFVNPPRRLPLDARRVARRREALNRRDSGVERPAPRQTHSDAPPDRCRQSVQHRRS